MMRGTEECWMEWEASEEGVSRDFFSPRQQTGMRHNTVENLHGKYCVFLKNSQQKCKVVVKGISQLVFVCTKTAGVSSHCNTAQISPHN